MPPPITTPVSIASASASVAPKTLGLVTLIKSMNDALPDISSDWDGFRRDLTAKIQEERQKLGADAEVTGKVWGLLQALNASHAPTDNQYIKAFLDEQAKKAKSEGVYSSTPGATASSPEAERYSRTSLVSDIANAPSYKPDMTIKELKKLITDTALARSADTERPMSNKVHDLLTEINQSGTTKDNEHIKAFLALVAEKKELEAKLAAGALSAIFENFSKLNELNKVEHSQAFKSITMSKDQQSAELTTHSGQTAHIAKTGDGLKITGSKEAVLESVKQLHLLELAKKGHIKLDKNGEISEVKPGFKFSIDPASIHVKSGNKADFLKDLDQEMAKAFSKKPDCYQPMPGAAKDEMSVDVVPGRGNSPFGCRVPSASATAVAAGSQHIVTPSATSTSPTFGGSAN